jgi:hypothetical protein
LVSKAAFKKAHSPLYVIWQELPYAGKAVRAGIDAAIGSDILMMAPIWKPIFGLSMSLSDRQSCTLMI